MGMSGLEENMEEGKRGREWTFPMFHMETHKFPILPVLYPPIFRSPYQTDP